MNHHQAFLHTRKRLAMLYTGTMGIILAACGFGFYQSVAYEHWRSLNSKLETIAGTLHDGIEPTLKQPRRLEPVSDYFLPGLICLNNTQCPNQDLNQPKLPERHIAGVVQQDYYIRFVDPAGEILAIAGQQPTGLSPHLTSEPWQTITDSNGISYRQISVFLKTQNLVPWGYIQVGKSLKDYETHLTRMRWIIIIGLPTAMLLVAGVSWWLSGVAMRPAYQAYCQIQQFTADAAHELRTPLAAIRSTVEFTLDEPELAESEARNTLHIIERQNNRLSNLVQDLLLLSRIDLHNNPIYFKPCNLNVLVEELVEEFAALAIASDLVLKSHIQADHSLMVLGDEEQLYRLFANLVTNAIQYTPMGGMVTIHLSQAESEAMLTVQDTGMGIPLAEQQCIFERFYRIESDRSRQTGGSGLGLSIAQAIALTHGGRIVLKSVLQRGSSFIVCLPLSQAKHSSSFIFPSQ